MMIGRSKVFPHCLKRVALNVRILLFAEHSRVELSLSPEIRVSMLLHSREMKLKLWVIINIHICRMSNMVEKDSVQAVWEESSKYAAIRPIKKKELSVALPPSPRVTIQHF